MQQLKNWLLKPYPFPVTTKAKILISLGFGKFIFLFLLIFQPFDFGQLADKDLYFAFLFGLITASVMLVNLIVLPLFFSAYFNPNKWVIHKMIGFVLLLILMIAVANWTLSYYTMNDGTTTYHGFSFFLTATASIGVFPLLIYLYLSERIKNKQHKTVADAISKAQQTASKFINKERLPQETVTFYGNNKKEAFTLHLEQLLYISFEKNYASIYYLENNKVKEQLIRTSLSKIAATLASYKQIVRCHKSYIVNTHSVKEMQGNARSYLLKIQHVDLDQGAVFVPVSRNFPKELLFTLVGY